MPDLLFLLPIFTSILFLSIIWFNQIIERNKIDVKNIWWLYFCLLFESYTCSAFGNYVVL